ncbi:MAG: chromosome partitioning protein ParB [Alphaproteobacteria bacterium BRH_c36]|nr:MAG: chromosome partitioning protein ParB [Alphaproteobacteria bacterium BRH_c36]
MNTPAKKNRLGRGLASLIGGNGSKNNVEALPVAMKAAGGQEGSRREGAIAASVSAVAGGAERLEGEHKLVALDRIKPSSLNPRRDFNPDDLAELSDSIRSKGLVQPILVRPDPIAGGYFEIVAGERRWRACGQAGLHRIPCVVRDLTDKEVLEFAIIENVQRADLNSIEEAMGYRELIERFHYSQEQISEIIGKSRSHVANTLRLLRLPDSVQALVQMGRLTAGHARALIGRDDAVTLAERIIADDLNVRAVEALVQSGVDDGSKGRSAREKDADTKAFEKELTEALGLKVEIKRGSGESGNMIIKYGNFDQLEYIRMRLTGSYS